MKMTYERDHACRACRDLSVTTLGKRGGSVTTSRKRRVFGDNFGNLGLSVITQKGGYFGDILKNAGLSVTRYATKRALWQKPPYLLC